MTKGRKLGAGIALLAMLASTAAQAAGELNLLTWEGYADPSFVTKFEEESGCKVNATYVGSNDDFAPKLMAGGGVYDLIAPSIDTTKLMIENFPDIVNYDFTAQMEDNLDDIERGKRSSVAVLGDFYKGFASDIAKAEENSKGRSCLRRAISISMPASA